MHHNNQMYQEVLSKFCLFYLFVPSLLDIQSLDYGGVGDCWGEESLSAQLLGSLGAESQQTLKVCKYFVQANLVYFILSCSLKSNRNS